jgi:hypothetical protein
MSLHCSTVTEIQGNTVDAVDLKYSEIVIECRGWIATLDSRRMAKLNT